MLFRPGNAGPDTFTDHQEVLAAALGGIDVALDASRRDHPVPRLAGPGRHGCAGPRADVIRAALAAVSR